MTPAILLVDHGSRRAEANRLLEQVAENNSESSNMVRHARALLYNPASNPYAAFATARSAVRKKKALWGRVANLFPRELPRQLA